MRTVFAGLLTTALLAAVVPAAVPPATATGTQRSSSRQVHLDGVTVDLRAGTRQVVTVNRTSGHHARVTYWARKHGEWIRRLRAADGRIGYGGLVLAENRHQGTGTTPLGTFRLPSAFGTHTRQDSWALGYRRIRRGDFWVEDNKSKYYNRYRNKSQGGFRWRLPVSDPNGSERLTDYPVQYEYSVVTSFNSHQVRHRGAGIFLHVNGDGATAGCVSAPRPFLRGLMARLDPDRVPVIAIGR